MRASPRKGHMDIEDSVTRESYRGFELTQLRQGNAAETRWYITQNNSGMSHSYGFAVSAKVAMGRIDDLLNGCLPGGLK
jgi:hypothetical protein